MNPYGTWDKIAMAWWSAESFAQDERRLEPAPIDYMIAYAIYAELENGWWEVTRNGSAPWNVIIDPRIEDDHFTLGRWRKRVRDLRMRAQGKARLASLRERLDLETGYREIWTLEEAIDASKAFAPNTSGAGAMLALIGLDIWGAYVDTAPLELRLSEGCVSR